MTLALPIRSEDLPSENQKYGPDEADLADPTIVNQRTNIGFTSLIVFPFGSLLILTRILLTFVRAGQHFNMFVSGQKKLIYLRRITFSFL